MFVVMEALEQGFRRCSEADYAGRCNAALFALLMLRNKTVLYFICSLTVQLQRAALCKKQVTTWQLEEEPAVRDQHLLDSSLSGVVGSGKEGMQATSPSLRAKIQGNCIWMLSASISRMAHREEKEQLMDGKLL